MPRRYPVCCNDIFLLDASPYITFFFFFNDTATTEIYTLSLHDALPICDGPCWDQAATGDPRGRSGRSRHRHQRQDRKSTRLNSSHGYISYAVFCLKKKKKEKPQTRYYQRKSHCQCLSQGFHHVTIL